ncbi:MAG: flavodoxin family protein [Anaerovoracaceae bacterium]|jgi:multimeric flavodoxin WrbA
MEVCILFASPRKNGNTAQLLSPVREEIKDQDSDFRELDLYDMDLRPCLACRACQRNWSMFGCPQEDDMQQVYDAIMSSDLILLASPIYSWYCTPPLKCVLDRMVYGMNKYYGDQKGPSLWAGKCLAVLTTCGYPPEKGADLFEEGIRRYCRHSQLNYLGMHVERHLGYDTVFMDRGKAARAMAFADKILTACRTAGKGVQD